MFVFPPLVNIHRREVLAKSCANNELSLVSLFPLIGDDKQSSLACNDLEHCQIGGVIIILYKKVRLIHIVVSGWYTGRCC